MIKWHPPLGNFSGYELALPDELAQRFTKARSDFDKAYARYEGVRLEVEAHVRTKLRHSDA